MTMSEQLTKMDLKEILKFLKKVYPGVADQDNLWNLIAKIEQLTKGKNEKQNNNRRGNS